MAFAALWAAVALAASDMTDRQTVAAGLQAADLALKGRLTEEVALGLLG
jgi:hypothetical protein